MGPIGALFETDPVFVVDSNTVLSLTAALESFQAQTRKEQIFQFRRSPEHVELFVCGSFDGLELQARDL